MLSELFGDPLPLSHRRRHAGCETSNQVSQVLLPFSLGLFRKLSVPRDHVQTGGPHSLSTRLCLEPSSCELTRNTLGTLPRVRRIAAFHSAIDAISLRLAGLSSSGAFCGVRLDPELSQVLSEVPAPLPYYSVAFRM